MASSDITTRFQGELNERFDEFKNDYELSKAEAVRRVADRGLSAYGYDHADGDKTTRLENWMRQVAVSCVGGAATVGLLSLTTAAAFAWYISPLLLVAACCLAVEAIEPDLSIKMGWEQ